MAGQMNQELLDGLTDFLATMIESKSVNGITYALLLEDTNKEDINKCLKLKKAVTDAGYGSNELFRTYKLKNGYIFDMDISVAKFITAKLAELVAKTDHLNLSTTDLIGDNPEKRREEDLKRFAKYCVSEFRKGHSQIEVALFSRNNVPRIVLNGTIKSGNKDINGRQGVVHYNAYAIRHWDVETVNRELLYKDNIKVSTITPCEILPSRTGVRFIVTLEHI